MKLFSLIFILIVSSIFIMNDSKASTMHNYAYCTGYSNAMFKVYRIKYFHDMKQFFESKLQNKVIDSVTTEYIQSGEESVKNNVDISSNLNYKCESIYKRKIQ